MNINELNLKNHIIKKILDVNIISDPFPHVVIDGYLPNDVYEFFMNFYPNKKQMFNPFNKFRTYNNVWQLDIVPDPFVEGSENDAWRYHKLIDKGETYEICKLIEDVIFSKDITNTWIDKFSLDKTKNYFQCGRLAIDGFDAGLGPHIDREDKYISNVLYFSKGNEPKKDCGTQLLTPIDLAKEKKLDGNHNHQKFEDFKVVSNIEYIPNRLIGWEVVSNSWHSYHQKFKGDRRSMKFFIQENLKDYGALRKKNISGTKTSQDWRSK